MDTKETTERTETSPLSESPAALRRGRRDLTQWLPLTAVGLLLGALCAAQWRTQQAVQAGSQQSRAEILAQQLADTEAKGEQMRTEIERLRGEISQYQKAAAEGENLAKKMNKDLQRAKVAAGLTSVSGRGIVVTLEDAPGRVGPGEDQSPYVIHDIDLLQIVNELRAADAEAIAINGQRLTTTSEIRCSGPVTKVNGTPIVPPYYVRAIGDPKALQGALELPGGVLEILRPLEIKVKITLKSEVELAAADTAQSFKYLKVVEPEAGQ